MTIAADTIKVIDNTKALDPQFKAQLSAVLDGVETITSILEPSLKSGYVGIFTDLNKIQPAIAAMTKLVRDAASYSTTLTASIAQLEANLAQLEAGATATAK